MLEFNLKQNRLRNLLEQNQLDGILLRRVSSFAWATCGAAAYVNAATSTATAALLVTHAQRYLITDNIEAPRFEKEEKLRAQGWEFLVTPWHTQDNAIGKLAPPRQEHKFYARVFQALRISVNHEIDYLKEMLEQALELLSKDGRLVVITYHSLEDRVVKNFMRTGNFEGEEKKDFYGNLIAPFRIINKKGTVPGEIELEDNRRARSARLRIAEKI